MDNVDKIEIKENNNNATDVFDELVKRVCSGDIPPEFSKILVEDFWNLI